MNRNNNNGQNSVATSAVTSVMASAFASEMDSIFAKATSTKKNFPIMNFLCNVKVGTKREMPFITENETLHGVKRNMLVTLLAPYGTSTMKGWVYQVNGKVHADSVVWLLEAAIDYIEKFEKHLNDYKAGVTIFNKKFIEVVEQYGVADLERRIAEMHQYFADLAGVEEQVVEQENEQEQDDAAIEYLREVMPVIPVDIISEKIDECVKDLNLDTMDFDKFCDVLWDDYVWDEVFTDEALESDTREWMEFNDRVRYIIENEKGNIFINCYDEIESEIVEKNDTPCLDIDIAVDRVVNTIKTYLANYTPSYLDQFGDCVITVYWDEFNEQDMQMLIEDDVFEGLVIDNLVGENISDMLVYDDGVYVTVDYDKMFKRDSSGALVDYLHDLDSRPAWVNRNDYSFKDCGEYLDIVMFGSYHIGLYYDSSESVHDFAKAEIGAYGKADMEYAVEIMENRKKILSLAKNAKIVEVSDNEFNKVA